MGLKKTLLTGALAAAAVIGTAGAALADPAIATDPLNVRSGPGTQFSIVDRLREGERVDVLGCRFGWCYIEHRGPDGWVSGRYLARPFQGRPSVYFNFDFGRPPLPPNWRPGRPWQWDDDDRPPSWWHGPVRPGRPGDGGGRPGRPDRDDDDDDDGRPGRPGGGGGGGQGGDRWIDGSPPGSQNADPDRRRDGPPCFPGSRNWPECRT